MNKKLDRKTALILLLVIGTLVRVFLALDPPFLADQSRHYAQALDAVESRSLPVVGPIMTYGKVFVPGGLYTALNAAALSVYNHPASLSVLIALLTMLSFYLFYLVFEETWGSGIMFLLAALPSTYSLMYSASIWNANMLMGFFGIHVFLLHRWHTRRHHAWLAGALLALACLFQVHFAVVFTLGPAFLFVFLCTAIPLLRDPGKRRKLIFWTAAGLFAGLLLYMPYLLADMQDHFANTKGMLREKQRMVPAGSSRHLLSVPVRHERNQCVPRAERTGDSRILLLRGSDSRSAFCSMLPVF